MSLTLVVVAKDLADLRAFDLANCDAEETVLVANTGRTPLSVIGNHYLDHARTPIVGLVHADTWFGPGALCAFTMEAFAGSVCGLVGIDSDATYRWSDKNPGAVSTLDSCSVFLRRDLGLHFDEQTLNSLHLHVEDLCLSAHLSGVPVVVPKAQAQHRSAAPRPEWLEEYWRYRNLLGAKWSGMEFRTT
jgi:hypothetical protein